MENSLPPKVRKAIYITVIMVGAVVTPLDQFNVIPPVFTAVWASVSAAALLLAAYNVPKPQK